MSNTHSTKKPERKNKAVAVVDDAEPEGRAMTAKQAAFVAAYSDGETAGNAARSAAKAGYGGKYQDQIGAQLLKLPKISQAIDEQLRDAIGTRLTVKSVRLLEQIIDNKGAPLKLRGALAVEVVKISGLVERTQAAKAGETGLGGKKLAEMSRVELEAVVRNGAAILHAAAHLPPAGAVIEGQLSGDSAPNSAQEQTIASK